MKNLKFPEISKEIQQSVFGAWGKSGSDDRGDSYEYEQQNEYNDGGQEWSSGDGGWHEGEAASVDFGVIATSNSGNSYSGYDNSYNGGNYGGYNGYGGGYYAGGSSSSDNSYDYSAFFDSFDFSNGFSNNQGGAYYNNGPVRNSSSDGGNGGLFGYSTEGEDWKWGMFLSHYENANGIPVNLEEIGLQDDIRNGSKYAEIMFKVDNQIEKAIVNHIKDNNVSNNSTGNISYDFINGYNFILDSFPIGKADVSGAAEVNFTVDSRGDIRWSTTIDIGFKDNFHDPWDTANLFDTPFETGTPFLITVSWTEDLDGFIKGPRRPKRTRRRRSSRRRRF